jgi:hypothetical protein
MKYEGGTDYLLIFPLFPGNKYIPDLAHTTMNKQGRGSGHLLLQGK